MEVIGGLIALLGALLVGFLVGHKRGTTKSTAAIEGAIAKLDASTKRSAEALRRQTQQATKRVEQAKQDQLATPPTTGAQALTEARGRLAEVMRLEREDEESP